MTFSALKLRSGASTRLLSLKSALLLFELAVRPRGGAKVTALEKDVPIVSGGRMKLDVGDVAGEVVGGELFSDEISDNLRFSPRLRCRVNNNISQLICITNLTLPWRDYLRLWILLEDVP